MKGRFLSMKEFFKSLNLGEEFDIAESVNGYYYFLRYCKEYNSYDTIIKFQSQEELKKILIEEFSLDLTIAIETTAEEFTYTCAKCESAETKITYPEKLNELCDNIEKIKNSLAGIDKYATMFNKML